MKKIMKKIALIFAIVIFVGFGSNDVFAQNEVGIDVSGDDDKMLNEDLIYPGWSKKKTVEVTNHSDTSEVDLYLNFKVDKGNTLADELKIYVIDSKGNYKIGGAGDKYTLKKADEEGSLFVEKLDIGESAIYQVKVKFDEDAGNDTQGKETEFDIDFTIEGEATEGLTEAQILTNQGRAVTGLPPEDEEKDDNKQISAASTIGEDLNEGGAVKGAETCNSWPLWSWIVLIIAYGAITYLIGRGGENTADNKRNLFWQVLSLVGALAVWYFFDTCRMYIWVPVVSSLIGIFLMIVLFNEKNKNKKQS